MEDKPNYYAIIPAEVRYSKIPPNAKLLYGEITALCSKEGFCWASNAYFAKLYEVSNTSISLWIKALKEKDFIKCEIENDYSRKIFLMGVLKKVKGGYKEILKGGIKKSERGVLKKVKDSNTISNINNNTVNLATAIAVAGSDINILIEKFKPINPSYERIFANKTQRSAIERMVKKWGVEKVGNMIDQLPEIIKQPYAPKPTKPLELEENLGKIKIFLEQKKNQIKEINPIFNKLIIK